jgi:hypothetical protein
MVMMMICAGKLGCRMFVFGRDMFAGNRVSGIHGPGTRGAMIRQGGAVTRQCGAARAGCCGVTAQSATRAVTTSAHMSPAATTAGVSATTTAGVSATAPATAR